MRFRSILQLKVLVSIFDKPHTIMSWTSSRNPTVLDKKGDQILFSGDSSVLLQESFTSNA